MVINQICDNTMIMDKFFSASIICLMTGTSFIDIQIFLREYIDLEESKLFVLDNNNDPHSFRRIYSTTNINVIDPAIKGADKKAYFKNIDQHTAHAFAVIWREI